MTGSSHLLGLPGARITAKRPRDRRPALRRSTGLGFSATAWHVLADALRQHGRTHRVARSRETGFGPRYELDGALQTPSGSRPSVRSVWQVDTGRVAPITAYPLDTT